MVKFLVLPETTSQIGGKYKHLFQKSVCACVRMPAFLIHLLIHSILIKKYFSLHFHINWSKITGMSLTHDSGMLFCPFAKHQCVCAPKVVGPDQLPAKTTMCGWTNIHYSTRSI